MFRNPVYDMMVVVPALLIAGLLALFVMTTPARAAELDSITATSTGSAAVTASTSGTTFPDLSQKAVIVDRTAPLVSDASAVPSALAVHSGDDLVAYARQMLAGDTYVESISLSPEAIAVTYYKPGRLLGFVPVTLPRTANVHADGSVSFDEPWYGPFTLADKDRMKTALEVRVHALLTSEGYLASMQLAPATQAEILDIVRQLVG